MAGADARFHIHGQTARAQRLPTGRGPVRRRTFLLLQLGAACVLGALPTLASAQACLPGEVRGESFLTAGQAGFGEGAVWILHMLPTGWVKSHAEISASTGGLTGPLDKFGLFGGAVSGLADLNSDGKPDLIFTNFNTGLTGSVILAAAWPSGVPCDFAFYHQWWIVDAGGPQGFAATLGMKQTTP